MGLEIHRASADVSLIMEKLRDIEAAVEALPEDDYSRFRRWFLELDWARWDAQIEKDSAAGRLDFLLREAAEAREAGQLEDL